MYVFFDVYCTCTIKVIMYTICIEFYNVYTCTCTSSSLSSKICNTLRENISLNPCREEGGEGGDKRDAGFKVTRILPPLTLTGLAGQTLSGKRGSGNTHIQYVCKLVGLFPESQVWQYLYLFDIFHLFTDSISKPPLDQ